MNQLLMSWKHLVWQFLFTGVYAGITAVWQTSTSTAIIFPGSLDWICASREGASEGCLFSECGLWFIYFAVVQSICYSVVLLLNYLKAKFCCRRSVTIQTYNAMSIEDFGHITAHRDTDYNKQE